MLEQKISADIEERQQLMINIKTLYLRYGFSEKDEQMFLIYAIPAVYSIWEGFVQTVFRFYVLELNRLNLGINTICNPILVYHIETSFKQFNEYPKSFNGKIAFFEKLNQFYNSEQIDITQIINIEGNVGFDVLKKILEIFNLQPMPEYYEPRYSVKIELEFLLTIRNAIAHGDNSIIVNRNDLDRVIKLVNILMDLIFDRIMEGFNNRTYLK